jgi:phenylpropionate dioxygenase-like ring-hydroxylating dioxygenase large terminal subunit
MGCIPIGESWLRSRSRARKAPSTRHATGLVELPAIEQDGLLWVHPKASGPISLDIQLGSLGPEIAYLGFRDLFQLGETWIEKRVNWKLDNDTFGETYDFSRPYEDALDQVFCSDALGFLGGGTD